MWYTEAAASCVHLILVGLTKRHVHGNSNPDLYSKQDVVHGVGQL